MQIRSLSGALKAIIKLSVQKNKIYNLYSQHFLQPYFKLKSILHIVLFLAQFPWNIFCHNVHIFIKFFCTVINFYYYFCHFFIFRLLYERERERDKIKGIDNKKNDWLFLTKNICPSHPHIFFLMKYSKWKTITPSELIWSHCCNNPAMNMFINKNAKFWRFPI
jgi:hypothetical protein